MWEYKTVCVSGDISKLNFKLNEFGKDNWEVYALSGLNNYGRDSSQIVAMKRPKSVKIILG